MTSSPIIEPEWTKDRVKSGLSSGEGLIYNVRDPVYKQEAVKDKGRVTGEYQQVMVDGGVDDKRLLVIEPEFASTLTVMARDGNTLSAVIRQSWDDGSLSPLTRNNPMTASDTHISIIGHITQQELLARMDDTSKANGFANRFLWAVVRRSKELPEGADVPVEVMDGLAEQLSAAIAFARKGGVVRRDDLAREFWARVYGPLSAGKPGMTGAICSRAEAQVLRLSVIYALLDSTVIVSLQHLKAALALWRYCEASAEAIFGAKLGDPVADRILEALRAAGANGLTDWALHDLFNRHCSTGQRDRALAFLNDAGLVKKEILGTGGRPKTVWFAVMG